MKKRIEIQTREGEPGEFFYGVILEKNGQRIELAEYSQQGSAYQYALAVQQVLGKENWNIVGKE